MQAVFGIPYGGCRDQEKIRVHFFPISSVFGVHDRQGPAFGTAPMVGKRKTQDNTDSAEPAVNARIHEVEGEFA